MNGTIKIILAILLFLCLLPLPYGYFQFVRFAAMAGFAYLAFQAKDENKDQEMWIFGVLAILFQPFFKISLGREIWNIVDVLVGIGLLFSLRKK
jgi:hypothetical protein